jgi:hypothetical protein
MIADSHCPNALGVGRIRRPVAVANQMRWRRGKRQVSCPVIHSAVGLEVTLTVTSLWLPKTLSAMTGPYRCAAASQNPVACCAFTQMPLPATVTVMPVTGLPGGMTVIVNGWLTWPTAVGANCTVTFFVCPVGGRYRKPRPG